MEQFIVPYKDKIYRFVLRMLEDHQDAEDIMQELAIKIWKRKERFKEIENKEAWCMTVARNLSIDKLRNRKKRQYTDINEAFDISDNNKTPYDALASSDTMKMLNELLSKLPDKQKETIHLREVEGLTYKEISDICEMSLEQVKSNIFRGRQALKEMLERKVTVKRSMM